MSSKYLNFDLYNAKYLKYKKKYLTLKKSTTGGGGVTITVMLPDKSNNIVLNDITLEGSLIEQIKEKLKKKLTGRIKVLLDDCPIEPYHTAEDCVLTKDDVLKIEYIDKPKVV